ncbi:MAG: HlyD family secretion protein [Planctomycetota bacterium]|jgi:multidrug efflux pump subunit AcrA (membrane-fusion protein)
MRAIGTVLLVASLWACEAKKPPETKVIPRPVTVIELRETDPTGSLLLTGSVISWKEQDVSFEVDGAVRFVVEQGTNLEGRWVEDRKVQIEGDKLALLDPRPYEIARANAAASVEVAKENLDTAVVQLEKVLPASLRAAEANKVRAHAEFKQFEELYAKDAASEAEFIRARADRDGRDANVAEAEANIDAQKAQIKSLEAQIRQAQENLRQADFDLERCTLYAPFAGEVSEVYIEAGGYARRGQRVAHLVMMQPIKVDLAVSDATAARLTRGDAVSLKVPGVQEMVYGQVYEKATTADPETRTFRVSILTRNERIRAPFGTDDPRAKLPRIIDTIPMMKLGHEGDLVEDRRSLRKDGKGYYVWADPAYKADKSIRDGTVLHLKKFYVTPGPRRRSLQGLYLMRELKDIGNLPPRTNVAVDPPDTDAEEQDVVIAKSRWLLRPGQLLPVLLSDDAPKPGIYLPMAAIQPVDEKSGIVFLAAGGTAKRVEVRLTSNVGSLFRIEGDGIVPGAQVIADYIHFLRDGEPVRVIKRRGS